MSGSSTITSFLRSGFGGGDSTMATPTGAPAAATVLEPSVVAEPAGVAGGGDVGLWATAMPEAGATSITTRKRIAPRPPAA